MKKRERLEGDSVLVRECEAFLEGTLAEYLDEQGLVVPVWAWTNLLAARRGRADHRLRVLADAAAPL